MPKVIFFVPNLIGYVRVIFVIASFYYMSDKPLLAVACFLTGGVLLDIIDGVAARHFNQCSKYGDFLDFITDRCARVGMMMMLSVFYSEYLFVLQLLVCLEISGCFSNRTRLALTKDHTFAKMRRSDPLLLRVFFTEPILSLTILGEDICISMLYLLHFSAGPAVSVAGISVSLWVVLAWICAPFLIYRQVVVCGLLLFCSFAEIADHDEYERRTVEEKEA